MTELQVLKTENKKLKKALKEIAEKYADNSSYYEEHLLKTDEVYKQAVEALK